MGKSGNASPDTANDRLDIGSTQKQKLDKFSLSDLASSPRLALRIVDIPSVPRYTFGDRGSFQSVKLQESDPGPMRIRNARSGWMAVDPD
jgi:hypothetical protein